MSKRTPLLAPLPVWIAVIAAMAILGGCKPGQTLSKLNPGNWQDEQQIDHPDRQIPGEEDQSYIKLGTVGERTARQGLEVPANANFDRRELQALALRNAADEAIIRTLQQGGDTPSQPLLLARIYVPDSAERLVQDDRTILAQIALYLQAHRGMDAVLISHSDRADSDQRNLDRVEEIAAELTKQGLAEARIRSAEPYHGHSAGSGDGTDGTGQWVDIYAEPSQSKDTQ